jgi:4,5-DOPA dioxygenase extradiol
VEKFNVSESASPPAGRMPVLFVGHGSPMNAIEDNTWSRGFRSLGDLLPRPVAILSISAHWYVAGTFTTGNEHPETIHDFGGFPRALYEVEYPALGNVQLANQVAQLLADKQAARHDNWGLDHGTWSVLCHIYPQADVPVVQLSIDGRLPVQEHLAIGRALAPLRAEGILIMGSGNIVHNLRHAMTNYGRDVAPTPAWAAAFDAEVTAAIEHRDEERLVAIVTTEAGRMSQPTLDHYLPLLYTMGAAADADTVTFPITGFDLGSLSMRSVFWK